MTHPPMPGGLPTPSSESHAAGSAPLAFVRELVRTQGDVAHYETAFGPIHFFNHPDQVQTILQSPVYVRTPLVTALLGQGLLASDGDWWRKQRRLVQPHFHERCLAGFAPLISDTVRGTVARWESFADSGEPLDITLEMQSLSLEIIGRALFGTPMGETTREICGAVTSLLTDLSSINAPAFQLAGSLSPMRNTNFRDSMQKLDLFVNRLIEERRAMEEAPRDLLSLLLSAKDSESGESLGNKAIRDEIVTMIIAGHEATAVTLIWTWHLIADHAAVEERLAGELEAVLGGRLPGMEDVPKLSYTRTVVEETMRLYPPVWFMMRRAEEASEVAGVQLPRGAIVAVCPFTTHRHPNFWSDPEAFIPERFATAQSDRQHRFAYLPFSGGRHVCIGNGFAYMELPLVIAGLASHFRIRPVKRGMPAPAAGLTLRAQTPTLVTLERRRSA